MGAPVHLKLPEELKSNFPNFEYVKILYGMTETMLMASWNDPSALGELDRGRSRIDFTNILLKDFTFADPKSAKKTDGLTAFFALL